MAERRVVVTGMGIISSVGNSVGDFWDSIVNGRSGIDRITRFDVKDFRTQIGGEVKNFNIENYMPLKEAKRLDLFCQYAVAACDEAMKQAGLPMDLRAGGGVDPDRVGAMVGSGIGGLATLEEQVLLLKDRGPGRVSPLLIPMMIVDMASGCLSMRYGAQGPNMGMVTACASACHAIGEAAWIIKRNDADIMITGGAESTLTPIAYGGFCSMKAMSQRNDDPKTASRPFDKDRDGFVMCEGAGILILEELEHAKKRGAPIYAEIAGYGATGDAYHITSPSPGGEGASKAINMALRHAGMKPEEVDYVNAHGTSTPLNDKFETEALKKSFGQHAYKLAVSSTKGTTGHGLGCAGGLETIACIKALQTGVIPPTINYTTPDPECDLDYTPNTAKEKVVNAAMNINLGFGGHNGVVIVKRVQDA